MIWGSKQPYKNLPREEPGAGKTFSLKDPRIAWHIGGIESSLAKNRAKMIGQALGNDESIIKQAGTENGAKQYIAQKTGTAREQGQTADGNQAFVHEFFQFNRNAAGSHGHPPRADRRRHAPRSDRAAAV